MPDNRSGGRITGTADPSPLIISPSVVGIDPEFAI